MTTKERDAWPRALQFAVGGLALFFLVSCAPAQPTTPAGEPLDSKGARTADALIRAGDRLARQGKDREAFRLWARAYAAKVPRYRGRALKFPIRIRFTDPEEFARVARKRQAARARIEVDRIVYRRFGFLEAGHDLPAAVAAEATSTGGWYSSDTKVITLPTRLPPRSGMEGFLSRLFARTDVVFHIHKLTLAHEIDHALADQHFDLHSRLLSAKHDDDMALAYRSVVEGEAKLIEAMADLEYRGLDPAALRRQAPDHAGLRLRISKMAKPLTTDVGYRDGPPIVQERDQFPYTAGVRFMSAMARRSRDWSWLDFANNRPPLSTEQIIHPKKFPNHASDLPIAVYFMKPFPLEPSEWSSVKKNVLGEFGVRVLLRGRLRERVADRAAAGWGGDLYQVFQATDSDQRPACLVWATAWDSTEDAAQFLMALLKFHDAANKPKAEAPKGVRPPFYVWMDDGAFSGLWLSGSKVWLFLGVPRSSVPEVVAWGLATQYAPKKSEWREHEPSRPFLRKNVRM